MTDQTDDSTGNLNDSQSINNTDNLNIEWQAPDTSNLIGKSHAKSILVVSIIIIAGFYILTRDIIGAAVITICIGLLYYFANIRPKIIKYSIKDDQITIDKKNFNLVDFKTYRILNNSGEFNIIDLIPLKRFSTAATLVIPSKDVNQILTYLSGLLPIENKSQDFFDKFMAHIKF